MSDRLYANSADRQRAYRERQRAARTSQPVIPEAVASGRPPRPPSRPARILALAADVRGLSAEYQNWRDRLPENLAEGETAARLEDVIAQLDDLAATLEAIDPPTVGR